VAAEWLFVGLGNPGPEYDKSPHNAGFETADRLRALCRGPQFSVWSDSLASACRWRGTEIFLAKPQTFMNRSGEAVARLLRRLDIPPDRMVVCYDDLDLPFGAVRLRPHGGAGGHHGMESILEHVGSDRFPRIRIGIDLPEVPKHRTVDFLLEPLDAERWALLGEAAERAAKAFQEAVHGGWSRAMSAHNRREPRGEEPPDEA